MDSMGKAMIELERSGWFRGRSPNMREIMAEIRRRGLIPDVDGVRPLLPGERRQGCSRKITLRIDEGRHRRVTILSGKGSVSEWCRRVIDEVADHVVAEGLTLSGVIEEEESSTDRKVWLSFRLTPQSYEAAAVMAGVFGITVTQWCRFALETAVDR